MDVYKVKVVETDGERSATYMVEASSISTAEQLALDAALDDWKPAQISMPGTIAPELNLEVVSAAIVKVKILHRRS